MAQNAYYWQRLRREEAGAAEEEALAQAAWRALPEGEQTRAALRALRQQYRTPDTMLGKKQPAWVQPFKVAGAAIRASACIFRTRPELFPCVAPDHVGIAHHIGRVAVIANE